MSRAILSCTSLRGRFRLTPYRRETGSAREPSLSSKFDLELCEPARKPERRQERTHACGKEGKKEGEKGEREMKVLHSILENICELTQPATRFHLCRYPIYLPGGPHGSRWIPQLFVSSRIFSGPVGQLFPVCRRFQEFFSEGLQVSVGQLVACLLGQSSSS